MPDREQWQLRGPVRSCHLERKWYSRNCQAENCEVEEHGDTASIEFLPDGRLSRRWHRGPNGSEHTVTYEYDPAGTLIRTRTESGTGVWEQYSYEYDNDGRLLRVLARNETGDRIAETYEYDTSGRKSKTLHVDSAAQHPGTSYSWTVEGTDSGYSAPGAAFLITTYHDDGQPARLTFRDLIGRELSRVDFRYDERGRLVEEAQTKSGEELPLQMREELNPSQLQTVLGVLSSIRRTHTYDKQGRRFESRSFMGPLSFENKTVSFNQQGDPLTEVHEDGASDFGIDEEGQSVVTSGAENLSRSETRFSYEYDAHANWSSKKVESRPDSDSEFSLTSVERRIITYFL